MQQILMLISLPLLVVGWVFGALGVFYLGSDLFGYQTPEEETALAAIWWSMLAFGVVSISGILADKANYASNRYLRQVYIYSIVVTATLFLGYLVVGTAAGLIGAFLGE